MKYLTILVICVILFANSRGEVSVSSYGVGFDSRLDHSKLVYTTLPKDCWDILENNNHNGSGIYLVHPVGFDHPLEVLCDMETKGGGWTHIIKRVNGRIDFYRGWRSYIHGFGFLNLEFNMGLQLLRALQGNYGSAYTSTQELLIEIEDRNGVVKTARYSNFSIGPEPQAYTLMTTGEYSGDAGDALTYHIGMKFSTYDLDQDNNPNANCAELYKGAWWYKNCFHSHLNGKFVDQELPTKYNFQGLHWKTFHGLQYCHHKARMMVRPAQV